MKISFHGAAAEVTGSQHLIEMNGFTFLLDCGLFQGPREETYRKNRHPSYTPAELTAVVLSHAHLDHSGKLPRLADLGFDGPVYATPVTTDLCEPMLYDSAHIQEKDLEFVNKLHRRKGKPLFNILYDSADVSAILAKFEPRELHQPFHVCPGATATYIDAGHLLGSAQIVLDLSDKGRKVRLGFTGDLGRTQMPILRDPEQLSDLDYLVTECTYGNRDHEDASQLLPEFSEIIRWTYSKGGKLIIPAFALERTQELLYHLAGLRKSGEVPRDMPVYVDSPLASKATAIFKQHSEVFDSEAKRMLTSGLDPFDFPGLHITESVDESKALNDDRRPMIIIAASGMCEAGRILHHLANNIENPNNAILIVSFQAEHTLGRRIANREKQVRIFGEQYELRARVKILNTFSGHAGRRDLIANIQRVVQNSPRLKRIFFVHGEPDAAESLMGEVRKLTRGELIYPERGRSFEL